LLRAHDTNFYSFDSNKSFYNQRTKGNLVHISTALIQPHKVKQFVHLASKCDLSNVFLSKHESILKVSARGIFFHEMTTSQACPWEWESHGKCPMGWDRHKLLWDGNGTDKYVPWTTLPLAHVQQTVTSQPVLWNIPRFKQMKLTEYYRNRMKQVWNFWNLNEETSSNVRNEFSEVFLQR